MARKIFAHTLVKNVKGQALILRVNLKTNERKMKADQYLIKIEFTSKNLIRIEESLKRLVGLM